MSVDHLAVKLALDQRTYIWKVVRTERHTRRNVPCPVCGRVISAENCTPVRQSPLANSPDVLLLCDRADDHT